jgi:hypothetical protein
MRCCLAIVLALVACKTDPPEAKPEMKPEAKQPEAPTENMDEKMRHCPLAIEGVHSTLTDVDGGVQFEIMAPGIKVAEVQRRAHHVVEFAAGRHDKSTHGVSDKQGGGTMRNCPVVTTDTTISVQDKLAGAVVKVSVPAERVAELRAESRRRVEKFSFVGATISVK